MLLNEQILEKIVNEQLDSFLENYLNTKFNDDEWSRKFWALQSQAVTKRIEKHLAGSSINQEITQAVVNNLDKITKHVIKELGLTGISDQTSKTQINMFDSATVIENQLITSGIEVLNSAEVRKNLVVTGDLIVKGDINTDSRGWQQLSEAVAKQASEKFDQHVKSTVIDSVTDTIKRQGIDIINVNVDGVPLIENSSLGLSITKSSLTELGTLSKLKVLGHTSLSQTLTVDNGRIGVNTETPCMAVDIWDDDVEIVAGKIAKNTGFIGTGRATELQMGVNRQKNISIDTNGLVTIDNLRIGKNRLSFSTDIPNYQGNKGDVVFNVNVTSGAAFAWVCLGQYKWLTLKAQT